MNEDYQESGRQSSVLSFEESCTGRSDQAVWTVVCKVDGEIKGTGTATTKAEAKNLASKQALEALGESTA
ncbi:hypothetical protein EV361DRAFT_943799 [Lentinula raphanica]|uniref:DRBM domain-containing protein n=1 Tax=Lentinula raphanica TaxID=153919 RepID=A0AA38PM92_9AGAR|nr:hypothetical protein C8R42DRAFT_721494 [Lentinula raphanica]KAJ3767338.1 hypothetical protein FB446DRAFT_793286 [Lentinula raphanica]KAJ3830279.1 hypothetical protein F5880DRAFT_1606844 [Lentinula raphanica]KAJ3845553.1 hypothetical protein F5878DRAFT_654911 [Lentinula raphanica]KAJ3978177.1 hypothetical protein EV361DRAFT_943799 [Lentinula raphanica]